MTAITTGNSAKAWNPDLVYKLPADTLAQALILATSTVAGAIEGDEPALRVGYITDDTADFVAEGADIDEADPTLAEALILTRKIAMLAKVSLENSAAAGDEMFASMNRAITRKANVAYLQQVAPTPPATGPSTGLLNVAGIESGDPVAGNLDALVDLIAELEANDSVPSHLLVDPVGWATLAKLKSATGHNTPLLRAGTEATERRLLGLPVIVTPAMPASTGLIVDKSAIVSAVGQVTYAASDHVYFTADSRAVRATWRIGHTVVHPDRLGKFTITDPDE